MTNPAYLHGWDCRCPHDRRVYKANRVAAALGKSRMVPAVGTIRRVQALQAIGWRYSDIAERTGVTPRAVEHIGAGQVKSVWLYVYRAISKTYVELENKPGPSSRTILRARGKAWPVPAAWDNIDDPKEKPKR